jgi:glycosyltransferase involved in cell wall biosynthesis
LSQASLENPTIKRLANSLEDTSTVVHACRALLYPGTAANLHRWFRRSAARELAGLIGDVKPHAVVVNLPTVERGQVALDAADLNARATSVWGLLHLAQRPSILGAKLGKLRDLLVPGLLRRFEGLMTVSAAGARDVSRQYQLPAPEVLHPPTATIPLRVLTHDRSARRAREQLPDTFLLGIVGRIQIHQKGHDAALRLTRRLLDNGLDMHLVVIGDGPDAALLRTLSKELRLGEAVTFMGWREDAAELIPLLSAVLMPSRYEGMPLVALQAAAAGVPVLGYAVDGLTELLPPEFVVTPGDETALVEVVSRLVQGSVPWPVAELSQRALSWASPANAAERLLEMVMPGSGRTHLSGSAGFAQNAQGTKEILPGQN